jgi:RNA recognition motif-containing protein
LKFNTGLEKNKLFIRGLPLTATKEDVEKLFSEVMNTPNAPCILLD